MQVLYLGVWCRPFSEYWAVPTDNREFLLFRQRRTPDLHAPIAQCSAAINHLITNAVLNISSDIMIILIPMPIFLQSRIALRKKMVLMGVFALGGFTVRCGPVFACMDWEVLTRA